MSLDTTINSSSYEFNAYVNADESLLIFSSFGRKDGLGGGDLYYSVKNSNGQWETAKHFDSPVNSKFLDFSPFYHNGVLFFSSERHDITSGSMQYTTSSFNAMFKQASNGNCNVYSYAWLPK